MKIKLFFALAFIFSISLKAQQLYNDLNAASLVNETNAVTGWTGDGILSSSNVDVQNGSYAMRLEFAGQNNKVGQYSFPAIIGEQYTIIIWAKRGTQSSDPAFANWTGLQGAAVTPISSTSWTQYTFNVTANNTNPTIRIFSGSKNGGVVGDFIYFDAISIIQTSGTDTEAPTAVTDISASGITTTTVGLSWSASTDNVGVTDYEVFQDGVSIGLTGGGTSFNVTGLSPMTGYVFTVFAQDAAGNVSTVSNTASVTTLTDTEVPTAVTDLSASGITTTTAGLSWSASTDNVGVTDYEVFQDSVSIGLTGGGTSFNVTGLSPMTGYVFTVFAQDAAGNVSTVSNSVSVTTLDAGGVIDYTSDNANLLTVDWQARDLFADRNVGIGTNNTQGYRLAVAGNVIAEEIKIALQTNWPDYVFETNYKLPTLDEVEKYIKANGHLINMPNAEEVKNNGIQLGEMNTKLLEKIEELTLYIIDQQKKINELERANMIISILEKRIVDLEKAISNNEK